MISACDGVRELSYENQSQQAVELIRELLT
jgi:uncharacterized protein YoaH (UPF0181 family)